MSPQEELPSLNRSKILPVNFDPYWGINVERFFDNLCLKTLFVAFALVFGVQYTSMEKRKQQANTKNRKSAKMKLSSKSKQQKYADDMSFENITEPQGRTKSQKKT